ncbi:hypothetical protein Dimus_033818 [Dionaea muscipula]
MREFYKNLVIEITPKKEVAKSSVHGVDIELDGMSLPIILEIPGNLGRECENVKVHNEENPEGNFEWEVVNKEAELQGEQTEEDVEVAELGSREKYYDAEDEERSVDVEVAAPEVVVPAPAVQTYVLQKEKTSTGVDLSRPLGTIPDSDFLRLQAELDRAREENFRLQALLQQATNQSNP